MTPFSSVQLMSLVWGTLYDSQVIKTMPETYAPENEVTLGGKMRNLKYLAICCALLLGTFGIASAQENATITGTVSDSSGAAVPGATITVTQTKTGEARITQSSGAGLYT